MKRTVTETRCDLCGYGGPYSRPEDFTTSQGYDFCKWCANPDTPREISSGGHTVTIEGASWQCDCGRTYGSLVLKLRLAGVSLAVMDAVPGTLAGATASIHVNTPNWPEPW